MIQQEMIPERRQRATKPLPNAVLSVCLHCERTEVVNATVRCSGQWRNLSRGWGPQETWEMVIGCKGSLQNRLWDSVCTVLWTLTAGGQLPLVLYKVPTRVERIIRKKAHSKPVHLTFIHFFLRKSKNRLCALRQFDTTLCFTVIF